MLEDKIIIRNETKEDYRKVENLTREAFWNVPRVYGALRFALLSQ